MNIKEFYKSRPRWLKHEIIGILLGILPSIALMLWGIYMAISDPGYADESIGWTFTFAVVYLFYFVPPLFIVGSIIGVLVEKIKSN